MRKYIISVSILVMVLAITLVSSLSIIDKKVLNFGLGEIGLNVLNVGGLYRVGTEDNNILSFSPGILGNLSIIPIAQYWQPTKATGIEHNFTQAGMINITTVYQATQNYTYSYETWWVNVTAYSAPDITAPYFTTIPANATITYPDGVDVVFVAADDVAVESYTVNDTRFIIDSGGRLKNNSLLGVGFYVVNVSVNDTSNNWNSTMWQANITKATGLVYAYVNHSRSNYSVINLIANNTFLNGTLITGNGDITLTLNDTQINTGGSPLFNVTNLSIGYYNFTVDYAGNENYTADVEVFWINISLYVPEAVPPTFTNLQNLTGYENESLTFTFTATDISGISCWSLNSTTNFSISCGGVISNSTPLSHQTLYWLNISVNDTLNNINYAIIFINITNRTVVSVSNVTQAPGSWLLINEGFKDFRTNTYGDWLYDSYNTLEVKTLDYNNKPINIKTVDVSIVNNVSSLRNSYKNNTGEYIYTFYIEKQSLTAVKLNIIASDGRVEINRTQTIQLRDKTTLSVVNNKAKTLLNYLDEYIFYKNYYFLISIIILALIIIIGLLEYVLRKNKYHWVLFAINVSLVILLIVEILFSLRTEQ